MIRRVFGPDSVRLRLRLLLVEVVASAGVAGVFYMTGCVLGGEVNR